MKKKKMKQNSKLNHFQQLLFHTFHPPLNQYNIFGLAKTCAKTAPRVPKLGFFS